MKANCGDVGMTRSDEDSFSYPSKFSCVLSWATISNISPMIKGAYPN